MIYGIGTDICDVRRIPPRFERHGERFAAQGAERRPSWRSGSARSARWPERGLRYLATRFSAKEAFSKAIGMGMRMPMTWRLCEIAKLRQRPAGASCCTASSRMVRGARACTAHVSVTDETDYAASFVVVEKTASRMNHAPSPTRPSSSTSPAPH